MCSTKQLRVFLSNDYNIRLKYSDKNERFLFITTSFTEYARVHDFNQENLLFNRFMVISLLICIFNHRIFRLGIIVFLLRFRK